MDKDFDFDNIGKRTPYRTPDNFFEETQRKILERTVGEQRKKRRLKRIIPTVMVKPITLTTYYQYSCNDSQYPYCFYSFFHLFFFC